MKETQKTQRFIVTKLLSLLCVILAIPVIIARSDSQDTSSAVTQTVIAGLKSREDSTISAAGYVINEFYNNSSVPGIEKMSQEAQDTQKMAPSLTQYFWAAQGQKEREDSRQIAGSTQVADSQTGQKIPQKEIPHRILLPFTMNARGENRVQYWNVEESNAVEWGVDETYSAHFGSPTLASQLHLGTLSRIWALSNQLKEQKAHFVGKDIVGGIETYKMESDPAPGKEFRETWWIAPNRSYMVLKREAQFTPSAVAKYLKSRVEIIDKIVKVSDDLWMPAAVRTIAYATRRDSKQRAWINMERWSFLSIRVNKDLPDTLFSLPLPPGIRVLFDEQGKPYTVKGDEEVFQKQLVEAKKRGEQPDMESIDLAPFKARIAKGQPALEETLDVPIQSLADDK